ncbi:transmembrane protein 45B-like [Ornithodoros turicata]|uniref:transmembrane protein 45B-like n=1 Tax=Ornithodoros turicata TaxID=34597 RepID=UPI00313A3BB2
MVNVLWEENRAHFDGHLFPGLLLFILGSWWCFGIWRFYFLGRKRFRSSASFPIPWYSHKLCFEGWAKITFAFIGIAGEAYSGLGKGHFALFNNLQHIIMYAAFAIAGVADILTNRRYPLPPQTDYMALLVAVLVEVFLFSFHLHGRSPLDVMVHKLLIYSAVAEAVFVLLEMRNTQTAVLALGRAFWAILHGAWFIHIAFMLFYSSTKITSWISSEDDQLTMVTAMFGWFMISVLVYVAVIGCLFRWYASARGLEQGAHEERYKLIRNDEVGGSGDAAELERFNDTD